MRYEDLRAKQHRELVRVAQILLSQAQTIH
jgi:hypothetical protein